MTTLAPATTETALEALYPSLDTLIYGVAIQKLDSGSVTPLLDALLPTAGRANLRSKGGEKPGPGGLGLRFRRSRGPGAEDGLGRTAAGPGTLGVKVPL